MSHVLATLDRLEGLDISAHGDVVSVLGMRDGTRVTFTGSADGVAEAAARFIDHQGTRDSNQGA